MSDSGPIPGSLLRLFGSMPGVEVIGVADDKLVSPAHLTELQPDLLLVNVEHRQKEAANLYEYFSRQLPHCKTIVFSKQCAADSLTDSIASPAYRSWTDNRFAPENKPGSEEIRPDVASVGDTSDSCLPTDAMQDLESRTVTTAYARHLPSSRHSAMLHDMARGIPDRRKTYGGRRQAEVAKIASDRFQSFVEQLPGMPYITQFANDGPTVYISPKLKEFLDFTPEQWCNDPALRMRQLHEDDRHKVQQAIQHAVTAQQGYCLDYRIHARDGSVHWFHDEARVMTDDSGAPAFLQGVVLDITERKQAQEELEKSHRELQELIVALDSLRAEEQKRLAHEMHDDLGQLLAAMKLDLCTLQQRLPPENTEACKYLSSINELVDTMVTSVRRIIADLPPKIVEDLGLLPALCALAKSFEQRHGLDCAMQIADITPEPPSRISTALYRIVQEALNNVAKHANATAVKIALNCCGANIEVQIADNGQGMPVHGARRAGSFGLIGMRERALALGGQIKIESREGEGTAIKISIPLDT